MRKNIFKKITGFLLVSVLAVGLAACGNNEAASEVEEEAPVEETTKYIQDKYALEREHYYLQTPEGYIEPYRGRISEAEENNDEGLHIISSNIINETQLWFQDDFDEIPTLYEGEKLVYRTGSSFDENFEFDRFFDLGYTVGLGNLESIASGRYKFNTTGTQIVPFTDASKFYELGETSVVIDTIGGIPLRKDMLSETGTITGLEKDKNYDVDVYMGTELQPYNGAETQAYTLKADARVMYMAQVNTSMEYEFDRSDIIIIDIPDYFNSGYYVINGFGIFRYVKGDSWDENTDFNIVNARDAEEAERFANLPENSINWTETLSITQDGSWVIDFIYNDDINEALLDEDESIDLVLTPYLKIDMGNGESYRFEEGEEEGHIHGTFNAPVGTYNMTIYNLYGRSFEYEMSMNDEVYDTVISSDIEEQPTETYDAQSETVEPETPLAATTPDYTGLNPEDVPPDITAAH